MSVEEGGSIFEQINTTINTVVGGAGAVTSIMNNYSDLQLTLAVVGGIIVETSLLLAFILKVDRFDVQPPLYRRAPVSDEYFKN